MEGPRPDVVRSFRAIVAPLRLRVTLDVEGYPMVAGRYGQLEWHDASTVAIYSQVPRMLARLLRVPGVHRHQRGDLEFRVLLPVEQGHNRAALRGVKQLLRLRAHRTQSPAQKAALDHGRVLIHQRAPQA